MLFKVAEGTSNKTQSVSECFAATPGGLESLGVAVDTHHTVCAAFEKGERMTATTQRTVYIGATACWA
jgi:hypothetical protein